MPLAAPARAMVRSIMVYLLVLRCTHVQPSRYESTAALSSAGAAIRIRLAGERDGAPVRRRADAARGRGRYVPGMSRKPPLADTLLAAVLAAVKLAMVATSWQIDGGSRP